MDIVMVSVCIFEALGLYTIIEAGCNKSCILNLKILEKFF